MNKTEALMLVRLVKGVCPAQQIDTFTPQAWAEVLVNTSYDDAKAAVITLARSKPFIALSDICLEVKRVRADRFKDINTELLGAGVPADDVNAFLDKVRADRKAIGDGVPVGAVLEIEAPKPEGQARVRAAIEAMG